MDELVYEYLLIKVNDPDDHGLIDKIKSELTAATPAYISATAVYEDK